MTAEVDSCDKLDSRDERHKNSAKFEFGISLSSYEFRTPGPYLELGTRLKIINDFLSTNFKWKYTLFFLRWAITLKQNQKQTTTLFYNKARYY